jgi:hypothetical protein
MSTISPYGKDLDINDKDSVKLYEKGSEKLSTKFTGEVKDLRLFIHDIASCTTGCKWDSSISAFKVNCGDLNLIKDYGRISMTMVTTTSNIYYQMTPTAAVKARPLIDTQYDVQMMPQEQP